MSALAYVLLIAALSIIVGLCVWRTALMRERWQQEEAAWTSLLEGI